jgi:hypothetical protein
MKARHIVTGYDAAGKALVRTDERLTAMPRVGAGSSSNCLHFDRRQARRSERQGNMHRLSPAG